MAMGNCRPNGTGEKRPGCWKGEGMPQLEETQLCCGCGEMHHKRKESSSHTKWWLAAGCCGLLITFTFIGITLWMGMETAASGSGFSRRIVPGYPMGGRFNVPNTFKAKGRVDKVKENIPKEPVGDGTNTFPEERVDKKITSVSLPIPEDPLEPKRAPRPADIQRVNLPVKGTLESGVNPISLEEMFAGVAPRQKITKKSEAVYPGWRDTRPVVVNPEDLQNNFRYPGFQNDDIHHREIPAFSFAEKEEYPYYYGNEEDEKEVSSPMTTYLQNRIEDVHSWLTSGRRGVDQQWLGVLAAVNESLAKKNSTIVFTKLKDMYYNSSDVQDMPISSLIYPADPTNASGLVSMGLLAIDLFLLHNVQQIAWNEERGLAAKMLSDPEVLAMNALFLPPDEVRRLRQSNSRLLEEVKPKSLIQELVDFVNGGLRAVVNLSKAYRKGGRSNAGHGSALHCVWTLYCRNLDITAKLNGPYGFLAKMNSLGLRLMMGEFPVERALEHLVTEYTRGWRQLDCNRMFPRCSAEEAKAIVLETALAGTAL